MIVVDASAAIEWLLRGSKVHSVEGLIFAGLELYAPHLINVEVAHVLRRLVRLGDATAERGREALSDLAYAPIHRMPHVVFSNESLRCGDNLSAYDAAYVAIAEALDAPLVTLDARLAKAAERFVSVHLV